MGSLEGQMGRREKEATTQNPVNGIPLMEIVKTSEMLLQALVTNEFKPLPFSWALHIMLPPAERVWAVPLPSAR